MRKFLGLRSTTRPRAGGVRAILSPQTRFMLKMDPPARGEVGNGTSWGPNGVSTRRQQAIEATRELSCSPENVTCQLEIYIFYGLHSGESRLWAAAKCRAVLLPLVRLGGLGGRRAPVKAIINLSATGATRIVYWVRLPHHICLSGSTAKRFPHRD